MFQILIVEDDKELSQLFQKVLEKNGYQVKSAPDGAQALEVLDKEYIDLIISDIMMPVMDGYELVSELRSAGYQIPVLMITEVYYEGDVFTAGDGEQNITPVKLSKLYFGLIQWKIMNFYITNGGVLIPQFGDVMDEPALKAIGSLFEGRKGR